MCSVYVYMCMYPECHAQKTTEPKIAIMGPRIFYGFGVPEFSQFFDRASTFTLERSCNSSMRF